MSTERDAEQKEMGGIQRIQAGLLNAVDKFNALDSAIGSPPREINKALWVPTVILVLLGIVSICIEFWWLPFLVVGGILMWNLIAVLSFIDPPTIRLPEFNKSKCYRIFHTTAGSNRIIFLALPLFLLALPIADLRPAFFAWAIALVLMWPLRALMVSTKKFHQKKFNENYLSMCITGIIGVVCFLAFHINQQNVVPVIPDDSKNPEVSAAQNQTKPPKTAESAVEGTPKAQIFQAKEYKILVEQNKTLAEQNKLMLNKMETLLGALAVERQERQQRRKNVNGMVPENVKEQVAGLEKEINNLKLINETQQVRSTELEKANKNLKEELAKLERENKLLRVMEKAQKQIEENNAALKKEIQQLKALSQTQEDTQKTVQKFQNQTQEMQQRLNAAERELKLLRIMEKAQKQIEERNSALEKEKQQWTAGKQELKTQLSRLQKENKTLRQKSSSLENPAELQKANQGLKEQNTKLERELKLLRIMEKAQKQIEERNAGLKKENQDLKAKIAELEQKGPDKDEKPAEPDQKSPESAEKNTPDKKEEAPAKSE